MRHSDRSLSALLGLLALAAPCAAQVDGVTWQDPSLGGSLQDAALVVLATATEVGRQGAAYRVERTLRGPVRDGEVLAVAGLHHPELRERPPVEAGDRAYLILRGDPAGPGFVLPTPTFGRFPLRRFGEEELVVASLGGAETFVRLGIPPARFEAFLAALGGDTDPLPGLLAFARTTIALGTDEGRGPDSERLYLALEVIARWGERRDRRPVLAVLDAKRYAGHRLYRVRLSAARALARAAGLRGAARLLDLAEHDPEPAVRSVAASAAADAVAKLPTSAEARRVADRLAALARGADPAPVVLSGSDDPRTNTIDSPLAACLGALARLRAPQGVAPALAALEREQLDAIVCGLAFFAALGDGRHAGAVAARMRPAESADAFVNRLFAGTLRQLTGEDLGEERAAWLRWWETRRPGGPVGPVGPPSPGPSPAPSPPQQPGRGPR